MAIILTLIYIFNGSTQYLANILLGNNEFTWYFWLIMAIYLTMPVLSHALKAYGIKSMKCFLIFWLLIIAFETFTQNDSSSIIAFIGYAGYPVLGYCLDNERIGRPKAGLVMMLISLATIVYMHQSHNNMINQGYLSLPILFCSIGAFIFIKHIPEIKNRTVKKSIESISISSYGMYFAHILIIKMLLTFNRHPEFAIAFAMTIFVSWLVTYALGKISYVKLLSGSMID